MGWESRPATESEIRTMIRLSEQWLQSGAVSFNTGLEYEPQCHATTEELVRLAKSAGKHGKLYAAHQRGYGDKLAQGLAETFEIAKQAEIPVHISHMRIDALAESLLERAERDGIDYTFDMYPYTAGSTQLMFRLPKWIHAGGPDKVLASLHMPERCERLKAEMGGTYGDFRLVQLSCMDSRKYNHLQGMSVLEAAEIEQLSPEELILELLRETQLQAMAIYHWPQNLHKESLRTYRHPKHMVGSDGFLLDGHPHPRGYGTFPTVLEKMVKAEQCLSLEKAIYKMSGFAADRFGLHRRGKIQTGHYADIVVLNLEEIGAAASFQNPKARSRGFHYVMVNGEFSMRDGELLSTLPGRILH
jgi:N-acyl-D-amino-acid deacylase